MRLLLLRPPGVVAGAVAGHGIATVVAVLGGSFLGKYLDEKVVQYVGGSLFLVSFSRVPAILALIAWGMPSTTKGTCCTPCVHAC